MLIYLNSEFLKAENSQICHNFKILKEWLNICKFASFEEAYLSLKCWFFRHLATKKALLVSAYSRIKSILKSRFLVQNEEDKLLHQLSWRRVWVVQTLAFGIYFAYLTYNL